VDNFIVRLRKLIEVDSADPRVIRSIRGVGYLLTEINRADPEHPPPGSPP
jgi:DNA-binding response OmpR family regulator